MYLVIEFTNYRKKPEVIVHGYTTERQKAIERAILLCKNQNKYNDSTDSNDSNDSNNYIYKIDELNINDAHIKLINGPDSKVLHTFFMTQIERTTDDECEKVCEMIIRKNEKIKINDITLLHLLDYFEVSPKDKTRISEEYSLDEKIGHDNDVQRYFIDLCKMKGYGRITEILDYESCDYLQVFGVVQIQTL